MNSFIPKNYKIVLIILFFISAPIYAADDLKQNLSELDAYQEYMDFFEDVYQMMTEHYYRPVSRDDFSRFLAMFDHRIYKELQETGRSIDFIRWRSAAYLVDYLKSSEDTYSAFMPPKPAVEYEQEVLGKKVDLGIEGERIKRGYEISFIEPRCDAYVKGLRVGDIITHINGANVLRMSDEKLKNKLNPLMDTDVKLKYWDYHEKKVEKITVRTIEYFKQTVFPVQLMERDIYALEIRKFNRKTSEDLFKYISIIESQGESSLILDLRDNPGGPPLAAREISSFFLTPGDDFAFFQKRNQPKANLDVPTIPAQYHYKGPMVILVNDHSGSASELFSGILQFKDRAILMGTQTAGAVFLKSMFYFKDDSMVLLVTARGHYPNGRPFSFKGLSPNEYIPNREDELMNLAVYYLKLLKT